jgi:hypothetical protein
MDASLYSQNHPAAFWKPLLDPAPTPSEWEEAVRGAAAVLPAPARAAGDSIEALLAATLGEQQFGADHWSLGFAKRAYYTLKPFLPRALTRRLRRAHRQVAEGGFQLDWPIEQRYADFQLAVVRNLMRGRARRELPFIHFWPRGYRTSLVLTHDVETAAGQRHILRVADLEERHGFRSQFNFVPERYPIDRGVIDELRRRGFEVGIHDLNHDGKLFSSRPRFSRRAHRINQHLRSFGADGFRAALTHRNPEWMQELDLVYDLSFFDTDPYEPIPGGTMSLWPFALGRFVEIPMTLVQDYTLTAILGERTPKLWLEKVAFLAERCGAAVLNSHPDYLAEPSTWRVYEGFLEAMAERDDCWLAHPGQVARWWRARAEATSVATLEDAVEARACLVGPDRDAPGAPGVELVIAPRAPA